MEFKPQRNTSFLEREPRFPRTAPRVRRSCPIFSKAAIILLLVSLAGLATIAKDGQYYRGANFAHQSSLSTKMNVTLTSAVLGSAPLERVTRTTVEKPRPAARVRKEPEAPPAEPIRLLLSVRHRSPPAFFSL